MKKKIETIKNWTPFKLVDPATLKPHPNNPNIHPAGQIAAFCDVLRANGWRAPCVVSNLSGYIIKGHGRLLAARAIGCKIPVEYQDYPDEAAEMRDLVADNKIAELSMLSDAKIAEIRAKFKDAGSGWGTSVEDSGLVAKQFGKLEAKKPKSVKFPILILQSQEEYDMFEALRQRLGNPKSDKDAFAAIMRLVYKTLGKKGDKDA